MLVALGFMAGCGGDEEDWSDEDEEEEDDEEDGDNNGEDGDSGSQTDGDYDPSDVKRPYGAWGATTRQTFKGSVVGVSTDTFYVGIIGEKEINGQNFLRVKVTYDIYTPQEVSETGKGAEFWFRWQDADTFEFTGFQEISAASAMLDTPIVVDIDVPAGEEQQVSGSGVAQLSSEEEPINASGTASYTLIDNNETLDTPMGPLTGCSHYQGTGNISGEGIPVALADLDLNFDVWYHPDHAIVKWSLPLFSSGLDIEGTQDLGSNENGFRTIQKIGVLDETRTSFNLSTYDVGGISGADKNTHAKMLLELRWLDEEKAKSSDKPEPPLLNVQFGTSWGYYEHELVESPVSIFHPEENGAGYKYWIAYVDQAAKNEDGEGVVYQVSVNKDMSLPAIRATARIYYKEQASGLE